MGQNGVKTKKTITSLVVKRRKPILNLTEENYAFKKKTYYENTLCTAGSITRKERDSYATTPDESV